ncbi:decaprenyl-phosphate phosphoribosyltransferase [Kribbella voronezhensis]|uniref:Decaprenyl-phosphate phosphoribosyltransferase n=1 Tax=Kribbella voronezhensis TaxID=2512212 RepID=A0A4R7SY06_9ACTN|nr:decaprenyl-phosphate phosphoribosyltransferase [Kribbella voronezhensis]TDU83596.1 decaprenyl-phosphate phosphoribosyltransferase [Kribbella voronezhensis]
MTALRDAPVIARPARLRSFVQLSRPQQWHKSLMLFAAPFAAGVIDQRWALIRVCWAAAAFTLLSVAVYATNDVQDAPDDRRHPRKQNRPVAAGTISPRLALGWAASTAVAGVVAMVPLGWPVVILGVAYLGSQLLYVFGLKHVAVVDVVVVATGFVLRAAAGAAAVRVPVSNWFLLVSLFGALFLVAGKRRAERSAPSSNGQTRPVLAAYSAAWLDQLLTVALLGASMSYGLWAFQYLGTDVYHQLLALSFLPFLTGLLRYGLLVSTGSGELPEHELFRDRVLLTAGVLWSLLVAAGLYLA